VAIATAAGTVTVTAAEACEVVFPVVVVLVGFPGLGLRLVGTPPPSSTVVVTVAGLEALVAVTVTGVLTATFGAVKIPSFEIVPALADQVTAVFGDPLIRAVNCNFSNDATVAVFGESDSAAELELEAAAAFCEGNEPQLAVRPVRQSKSDTTTKFGIIFLFPGLPSITAKSRASCIWDYLGT
jgi:hypothetical protein